MRSDVRCGCVAAWRCDVEVWRCRCGGVEVQMWRCGCVDVWRCRCVGCGGMDVYMCEVWMCGSVSVKVWICAVWGMLIGPY